MQFYTTQQCHSCSREYPEHLKFLPYEIMRTKNLYHLLQWQRRAVGQWCLCAGTAVHLHKIQVKCVRQNCRPRSKLKQKLKAKFGKPDMLQYELTSQRDQPEKQENVNK